MVIFELYPELIAYPCLLLAYIHLIGPETFWVFGFSLGLFNILVIMSRIFSGPSLIDELLCFESAINSRK